MRRSSEQDHELELRAAIEQRAGLGALTPHEWRLVAGLRRGGVIDASDGGSDSVNGRGRIRAALLRHIMQGHILDFDEIDPHGLQLSNAHLNERLDLDNVASPIEMSLHDCTLMGGVGLIRADLRNLSLTGETSVTAAVGDIPVDAYEVKIAHDLTLACSVTTSTIDGAVHLTGAHIGGRLMLTGGPFTNSQGPALSAGHLKTGLSALLDAEFRGYGQRGAVRLSLAQIGGQLLLNGGPFINPEGPALSADGLKTGDDMSLEAAFQGHGGAGAVRLIAADIGGQLMLSGGPFINPEGPALSADHLRTAISAFLAAEFRGHGERGAIRLSLAHVAGQLVFEGGPFTNPEGPALDADGLKTGDDISLGAGFQGHSKAGAVRLLGAHIGGQLRVSGGPFINSQGPALHADTLKTTLSTMIEAELQGHGELGAVRLSGANIGGQLRVVGGPVINPQGPALHADGLKTGNGTFLSADFQGNGELGAVRLLGAHIGGQLLFNGGSLTNPEGPALSADNLKTENNTYLQADFRGQGDMGAVRLSGAHIGGQLHCTKVGALASTMQHALDLRGATVQHELALSPDFATQSTPPRWLALDGLAYRGLPLAPDKGGRIVEAPAAMWVELLRYGTASYAAQPWQHLAAAYRAGGHENDAKRVLIAQQDDRRDRVMIGAEGPRRPWLWMRRNIGMRCSKLFTAYGYRTSLTLRWLLGWTAIGIIVGLSTGWFSVTALDQGGYELSQTAAAHGRLTTRPGSDCSFVERVGLGVEWALPIIKTGASSTCVLNKSDPIGQWLTAASWGVQGGGWALATLVVAGYTGLVRRV